MSKRVPVYMNENELQTLLQALSKLHLSNCITKTSEALIDKLSEELERSFDKEEDDPWSPLYNGSKDRDK